jgi:hypothetical protein
VRTIGIARATVKIGLANLAYNMRRTRPVPPVLSPYRSTRNFMQRCELDG